MKNKLLILLLLFAIPVYSQTVEELQDAFFYISVKLDKTRDSVNILKKIVKEQDENIIKANKIISKDSIMLRNDSAEIENFKIHIATLVNVIDEKSSAKIPLISWGGFWAGFNTVYLFDNENKSTFSESLLNGIGLKANAIIKYKDNIMLIPSLEIPLKKDFKTSFKFEIMYRLF